MWPLFFNKSLITGNPQSSVGICTLWSKTEFIAQNLPKDKYNLAGNLYTADGISYLIKNILANPIITHLIICGQDYFKSGEALINFFKNGIDQDRKIIGSGAYLHSNIPMEAVELVRKNIEIIDLRGKEGELPNILNGFSAKAERFADPLVLPDETEKQELLTSEIMGFRVEGGLSDVWLNVLDLITKFGEVKASEHELKQKEVLDVMSVINNFSLEPFLGLKEEDVKKYVDLFFSADTPKEIEYTYGKRLFRFAFEYVSEQFGIEMRFFVDQIDGVVKRLKKSPYSRRAVAGLWNPFTDADSGNPPCLTQITWNVKNGKIYQTCIFRSHDLFGAYLLNALALRRLQEKVSNEVGLEPGSLIILSQSAHIYENSWKKAEILLNTHHRNKEMEFRADRSGYFLIKISDNKEITAQHYLIDGRKTKYELKGKDAVTIYKKILQEHLVSQFDHAAYLGRELTKAEECIKNNKEYDQESLSG
ncbi:MAG: thymidylate synthase [Patescibacteria group bacterium]